MRKTGLSLLAGFLLAIPIEGASDKAFAHISSQCDSHMKKYLELRIEKMEMDKKVLVQSKLLLEMKMDQLTHEVTRISQGKITPESLGEMNQTLEQFDLVLDLRSTEGKRKDQIIDDGFKELLGQFQNAILFESALMKPPLEDWIDCMVDFRQTHDDYLHTTDDWIDDIIRGLNTASR